MNRKIAIGLAIGFLASMAIAATMVVKVPVLQLDNATASRLLMANSALQATNVATTGLVDGTGAAADASDINAAIGAGPLQSPLLETGEITVTNVTANTVAGFDASKVLVSLTVGSGLNLSGGTLTATGGSSSTNTDVQRYFALGTPATNTVYTWVKPANAKHVRVIAVGGGGGGGSGRVGDAASDRSGGGGGAGGNWSSIDIGADLLSTNETVTVGAGGAGGAAAGTTAANGAQGADGGASSFGTWCVAGNGSRGSGGTTTTGTAGNPSQSGLVFSGSAGGGGANTGGNGGGNVTTGNAAAGGGGGGGINAADAQAAGSSGGSIRGPTATISGGTAGNNGTSRTANFPYGGSGGGGSAANKTGDAAAGGNGGIYGGGGGGGGASLTGFTSGAGGNGANGIVIVITEISP